MVWGSLVSGLRKILEREVRFVLRKKLPYKAAWSWPAELSRSEERDADGCGVGA